MEKINPTVTTKDFKPGEQVRYVPSHAVHEFMTGYYKDIENGIVKSVNDKFVFVNYIRNGIFQETAEATDPKDLIR